MEKQNNSVPETLQNFKNEELGVEEYTRLKQLTEELKEFCSKVSYWTSKQMYTAKTEEEKQKASQESQIYRAKIEETLEKIKTTLKETKEICPQRNLTSEEIHTLQYFADRLKWDFDSIIGWLKNIETYKEDRKDMAKDQLNRARAGLKEHLKELEIVFKGGEKAQKIHDRDWIGNTGYKDDR